MNPIAYRSLYTYAWDIQDIGVTAFVDEMLAMGITDVSLATSYHAGKFLRPHAKNSPRVIFPEDGVLYFEPNYSRYGDIKPQEHSEAALRKVLPNLFEDGRLKVHSWTVLLHNTRIGSAYPQFTTKNVFGDSYVYSLCPMQEAVFEYAIALCADLSTQFPFKSIILETPGWLPYNHGYHHEFAQTPVNPWLESMLSLCFCDACVSAAKEHHIAIDLLQVRIQNQITDYLADPIGPKALLSTRWTPNDPITDTDLQKLIRLRQDRVTELVKAIRDVTLSKTMVSVIPTVQRPTSACWIEGSDLHALSKVADFVEIPFYEKTAQRSIEDAQESLAQITNAQKIRAILRPGLPDLNQGAEINEAIEGLRTLGITDFAFYNYGLLPQYQLDRLSVSLHKIDKKLGKS